MIDQDYVQQMEAWIETMELSIQQEKNYIKFHDDEIKLHNLLKASIEKQLIHDETRLIKARQDFEKYLQDNASGQGDTTERLIKARQDFEKYLQDNASGQGDTTDVVFTDGD